MKYLLLLFGFLTCLSAEASTNDYPILLTLRSNDLFVVARPRVITTVNIPWGQLSNFIAQPAVGNFIAKDAGTGTNITLYGVIYGANAIQLIRLPNQQIFTNSLYVGNGGSNTSRTGTAPIDPEPPESAGTYNGLFNTFIGINAGLTNTTGNFNTFVGMNAGGLNTNGAQNTFIGGQAGSINGNGYHDTYVGAGAGQNNNGYYNTLVGTDCGLAGVNFNECAFFGTSAGGSNTANGNSFFGTYSGSGNTSGNTLSAFGYAALTANTTGVGSSGFGSQALFSNKTGNYNVGEGGQALFLNLTGSANTGIGYQSLYSTTSDNNTGIGYVAGRNATGGNNSLVGYGVMYDLTSGIQNTAMGYNTGRGIITGNNNTFLGANITGLAAGLSGTIIISDGLGNQRIYIDSSGQMGVKNTSPASVLDVAGDIRASTTITATNSFMLPTNYVAANFIPTAGMVKICASNGILYKVTQLSTNLLGAGTP